VAEGTYAWNPHNILEHCKATMVLDKVAGNKALEDMISRGLCTVEDKDAIIKAVTSLVDRGELPPGQVMQEKVSYYLYHFAQHDSALRDVLERTTVTTPGTP